MTEFAYIEHLDIPEKRRGSILHAEEYNATVGKINEIVDSLRASYNYNNSLPNFDEISDISQINTENGTPVIIHNVGEKYYPVTSSSYVTVGDNKYLDTELTYIKSELDTVKSDVESIEIPSYHGSDTINIDDNNVISVNTSNIIDEIIDGTTLVNADNKITVNPDVILHDVIDNIITNANDIANIQDELSNIHSEIDGIEDKSYYGSTTININDNNEISVNVSELVNDSYLAVTDGKIDIKTDELLNDIKSDISYNATFIDDVNSKIDTEIGKVVDSIDDLQSTVDAIDIPSYYGSDTINVDNNIISVNTSAIIADNSYITVEDNKIKFDDEALLQDVNSKIDTNTSDIDALDTKIDNKIDEVQQDILSLSNIVNDFSVPSYYGSDTVNVEDNIISVNVDNIIDGSYLTVENNKVKLDSESLLSDVNSKIDTNTGAIDALDTKIDTEIAQLNTAIDDIVIPSYYGTDTINIENGYVSVNVDNIIDGSYLTVEDNKVKLDSESLLSDVNSKIDTNASNIAALDTKIDTEIDNVQQDVLALSNIVNDFNVPSYYGTDTIDINDNQISVNTSYLISYIIDNDTIIAYNDKIKVNAEEVISELSEDIENKINHVNDLIEDVSNVVQQLESSVSYFPGDGINIDEHNVVSADLSYIADNIIDTTYLSVTDGKIGVDADTLLQDVKDDISYNTTFIGDVNSKIDTEIANINNTLDELSDSIISEIPSYIAGDGINIDENNVISLDASYLIEDVEKPSIYLNEQGKLVVNNEIVLADAESQFKFIDEHGNWVGDMANVKNYIDEQDTALDNKMDNIKNEIYTYVSKFTEYDTLGKDYAPSVEFINRNKN